MGVVENRIVRPIGVFDLVETLRDQKGAHAITRHEGKRAFEEFEFAKRWKLIKHQQHFGFVLTRFELFGETSPDLIEDEPHQRFGSRDVRWRHREIKRQRIFRTI